jgi:protoporphyrinogen IX oxidase
VLVWLKLAHVAALALWCAALFGIPALLAAYPEVRHARDERRLRAAARACYILIASPAAVVAIGTGAGLIAAASAQGGWLALKLTAVSLLVLFHVFCGRLIAVLHDRPRLWPPAAHLSLIAAPSVLVPVTLWLVLAQPF